MGENKFVSVLKTIGQAFLQVLHVAENVAVSEMPVIAKFNPALAAAIELGLNTAITVESAFAAMGRQVGTGPQKLATAMANSGGAIIELLKQAGVDANATVAERFINDCVAILNNLPKKMDATLAEAPEAVKAAAAGAGTTTVTVEEAPLPSGD